MALSIHSLTAVQIRGAAVRGEILLGYPQLAEGVFQRKAFVWEVPAGRNGNCFIGRGVFGYIFIKHFWGMKNRVEEF